MKISDTLHLMRCFVSIKYMHMINILQNLKIKCLQWSFLVILFVFVFDSWHEFRSIHQISNDHLNNLPLSMGRLFSTVHIFWLHPFFFKHLDTDHHQRRSQFLFPVHRHCVPISSGLLMILLFLWCINPLPFHDNEF